jgi:hypothetical protein
MSDEALALSKTGNKIEDVHSGTGGDVQAADVVSKLLVDVDESVLAVDAAGANTAGEEGGAGNVHATIVATELLSNILEDACATSERNEGTKIRTAALKMQSRFYYWALASNPTWYSFSQRPRHMWVT